MEANQAKYIQIFAAQRTERKKKIYLKKKVTGTMTFVGPEPSRKNN